MMDNLLSTPLFAKSEISDEQRWLPEARLGRTWALEQFYDSYQSQIYNLCYRILGRPEDAEDVMQTAFVRAFTALPNFRGASSIKTWLYRIAVNESMTLFRKQKHLQGVWEGELGSEDRSATLTEQLAIQGVLTRLKPEHRLILTLRFWEDLSYQEIAFVLRIPLTTVKMRLKRAKEEFRKGYEEHP